MIIADIGFALSTVGYFLLLLLLLTVRKPGLAKLLLIFATAATSIWSASHITSLLGPIHINQLFLFDNLKQLFWLVFLLACVKHNFTSIRQVLVKPISLIMLPIPILAMTVPLFIPIDISWRFMAQTIVALQILVMLELIYRQAGDDKWAFKPLVLFLGATNLFEFVTFANATMVGNLEVAYITARGYIYVALLPFLVLAIRRIKHWGVDIFISRDVVLHSSLLMVAGAYLFIMALVGYFIRFIGGEWGATIQVVLIALSTAMLMTLFLSNNFRVRIKVFITKHFFANQFDYRIEWLKLTEALSSNEADLNGVYQCALRGLLQAIDYESGALIKLQGNVLVSKAMIDHPPLNSKELQLLQSIVSYCQRKNWIIDIEELRYKPFVYEGLKLNHALLNECAFRMVIPIYKSSTLWGLAVLDTSQNSRRLNWELRDYLSAVTAQVSSYVFHNEAGREVAENAQFAAFSRMSAFVLHDLKNVLAQIDLILCNAEQHKDNPEFIEDTFETLQHTKARIDKMLRQLTDKNEAKRNEQKICLVSNSLKNVIETKCVGNLPKPSLSIIDEKELMIDDEKFGNVMYHLISNAQQATPDSGQVNVTVDISDDGRFVKVVIADTGEGMSQDFIDERLFKPFDTTKGNAGMGIGAYDAKSFVERVGGQIEVQSEPHKGAIFTLTLPIK